MTHREFFESLRVLGPLRVISQSGPSVFEANTAADFDPTTVTSLLHRDAMVVRALRANPSCALLFYVFDLDDRSEEGRFRCLQLNCRAELHEDGALFDNVWWHNVFHGKLDDQVMVRFVHQSTYDTRFGGLEAVDA